MRRRRFLGYTGLTSAAILTGGLLKPSEIFAANYLDIPKNTAGEKSRFRMTGGRCHDHRFLNNDPTLSFEREIFGA